LTASVARPRVRGVVFDLDGTLVDSRAAIVAAVEHAFGAQGRRAPPAEQIAGYIGDGARALIARSAGLAESDGAIDGLLEGFLAYYTAHIADHTTLMPGALHCLDELAALPLAVCTNKPRVTTLALLDALGIADRFRSVVAGGDVARNKPAADPLLAIARDLELAPEELAMVGDGPQDIECGRAAGARTVGVEGGILPRERLIAAGPEIVIASLGDLAAALRDLL
jgi:2-phosphoglycolate phosphatase